MTLPDDIDDEKLAEIALAMLSLSAFSDPVGTRAWKGMDWDVLNLLYEKGWIMDPKNKSKSVVLTTEGEALAQKLFAKHFGNNPE